jgi:saccharopine dehydrogenase-like NADP-dependent oxidoreductase
MGRYVVRTAVKYDFVDEIVVADLELAAAERVAGRTGSKARAVAVDAADPAGLRDLLRGADVVLNTVGPFYRFGVPILEAAIDAGCHYLDICDDWEPTLAMLELDSRARNAGVTAIVGVGASPGVSNLLAAKAISRLDAVEEVITGWGLSATDTGSDEDTGGEEGGARGSEAHQPSAAIVHWMHQCSGTIRVRRSGRFEDVKPVQEMRIDYPGIGVGTAWSVGHPEAVTLPLTYTEIQNSTNVMVGPRFLIEAVRALGAAIDTGDLSVEEAAVQMAGPVPPELREAAGSESRGVRLPPLFALARGRRGSESVDLGALVLGMPAGGMGGATGVPLAVGLSLFAQGRLEKRGVFAPEGIIDPDAFFDALAPLCSPAFGSGREMLAITESGGDGAAGDVA